MQLERLLSEQGFGTRRECRRLAREGRVRIAGVVADDPFQDVDLTGAHFEVDGVSWPYFAKAVILLHKPAGYECSRHPKHHPGVHVLLPPQFSTRNLQCVGRLDADTTGLLLLTDDGPLIHALSSPRRKVEKRYRVTTRHPLDARQIEALRTGVVLRDDPEPVAAEAVDIVNDHTLDLALTSGRYHQVKRMLAAVGNRVEALCRVAVGGLVLPDDLPEGHWRWLFPDDLALLWKEPDR